MQSLTILVTGGAGYIGSHTVVTLIRAGYSVIVVDDLSNSRPEILNGIEQITGTRPELVSFDLCDAPALRAFFKQQNSTPTSKR